MDPVDPVNTLSFAWNLISYVAHVDRLLSSNTEVSNAPKPAVNDTQGKASTSILEDIHAFFEEKNRGLWATDLTVDSRLKETWEDVWAFNDVASVCRGDYEALDLALKHICANVQSTQWSDFRTALQSHWYANEIETLEQHCRESRVGLCRHICSLTRFWVKKYQENFGALRENNTRQKEDLLEHDRHQVGFSSHFEAVSRHVSDTNERLRTIEADPGRMTPEDVDFLRSKVYALDNSTWNVRREQATISSLGFEGVGVQYRSVPNAVDQMFDWAISSSESPSAPAAGNQLRRWLRQGSGIVNVTGGSGSGKSMLLKYVSSHRDVGSSLYQWSNPKPVIIASHFFSDLGCPMQKSLQGMLQTLLRTILLMLPTEVDAVRQATRKVQPETLREHQWATTELLEQLTKILVSQTAVKFCIFIDGIDGYDGNTVELAAVLESFIKSGNAKICISSRPETRAQSSFSVPVQDIDIGGDVLRRDLEIFVSDRLHHHPLWQSNQGSQSDRMELARSIADGSRSFLVARIAVEHLRSRYRVGQGLPELKRLLGDMPLQLAPLVKHCLQATPVNLAQPGAWSFLVTLAAKTPPPLSIYHFLDTELIDPDYALKLLPRPSPSRRTNEIAQTVRAQLERRCGVFLQVRTDMRVEFSHRAIREVIQTHDIMAALRAKAGPNHPHVLLSLARAYLAYMKTTKFSWGRPTMSYVFLKIPSLPRIFGEFLGIAGELDTNPRMHQLLDDWEGCIVSKSAADQQQLSDSDRVAASVVKHFREPVLDALLSGYIATKLTRQNNYLDGLTEPEQELARPALSRVLSSLYEASALSGERNRHIQMLRCLIRHKFNPNDVYQARRQTLTPWTHLVRQSIMITELKWSLHSGLLSLFLRNRADPNSPVAYSSGSILEQPGPYTSSWVVVFCSMSEVLSKTEVHLDESDQRACLQLLDDLISAGASAQYSPSCAFFQGQQLCNNLQWARALLNHLFDGEHVGTHNDLNFRAAVAERLLSILVRSGHSVGWCWPILSGTLPSDAYASTQEKIAEYRASLENNLSTLPSAANGGKRASSDVATDSETSSKRARSEAEDETMTMTLRMEPGPGSTQG